MHGRIDPDPVLRADPRPLLSVSGRKVVGMDTSRKARVRRRRAERDPTFRARERARGELDGACAQAQVQALLAGHGGVARVVWSAIVGGRVRVARSFWQSCGSSRHYVVLLEPAPHGPPRRHPSPPPSGRGRALVGSPTVVVTLAADPDLDFGVDFGAGADPGAGGAGGSAGWVLVSAVRVVLPAPIPQITGDVAVVAGWLGLTIADLTEITDGDPVLLAELAASGSVTGATG